MISGTVNADLEAIVTLLVQDASGQAHQVDAVIDTGFNRYLTLPLASIAAWSLPWLSQEQGFLADSSVQGFDVHEATIIWDGQPRTVETEAVDTQPLIGMAMLANHDLQMQVKDGGPVTIQAIP